MMLSPRTLNPTVIHTAVDLLQILVVREARRLCHSEHVRSRRTRMVSRPYSIGGCSSMRLLLSRSSAAGSMRRASPYPTLQVPTRAADTIRSHGPALARPFHGGVETLWQKCSILNSSSCTHSPDYS